MRLTEKQAINEIIKLIDNLDEFEKIIDEKQKSD